MGLIEKFRIGIQQLGLRREAVISKPTVTMPVETGSSLPPPDVIDLKTHALHFYPGFEEFVFDWNAHASTDTRRALHANVLAAQSLQRELNPQFSFLQEEVLRLKAEQARRLETFNREDVPRKQKIQPLKKANRNLRRAREELDRVSHQEAKERQKRELRLAQVIASLLELDEQFALKLDQDRLGFYLVERLRDDPVSWDALLLKYCFGMGLRGKHLEMRLWNLNYRLFSLARHYGEAGELGSEEHLAKANEATERQLKI